MHGAGGIFKENKMQIDMFKNPETIALVDPTPIERAILKSKEQAQ